MGEIRPKECEPRELTKDQLTGFEAGGVGPCGFPAPLHAVFVEERVFAQSDVWCGAGVKPAMFRCTPTELLAISGGSRAELAAEEAAA